MSKPRGVLRDITLVLSLLFFVPNQTMITLGAGLFVLGLALHIWSKGCLERNCAVTTLGPYAFVRHPFYLASFLIDEGICLASGNLWLCGLYAVGYTLVYLPTIRNEEAYLSGAFGGDYATYARRVPALAPYRLHTLVGAAGFAWHNLVREKEFSRALRLLAVPAYFGVIAALFHTAEWDRADRTLTFLISIGAVLTIHVASHLVQKYERARRLTALD